MPNGPEPSIHESRYCYEQAQRLLENTNDPSGNSLPGGGEGAESFEGGLKFLLENHVVLPGQTERSMNALLDSLPFRGVPLQDAFVASIVLRQARYQLAQLVARMRAESPDPGAKSNECHEQPVDLSAAYDSGFTWQEPPPDFTFGLGDLSLASTGPGSEFEQFEPARALTESLNQLFRKIVELCGPKVETLSMVKPFQFVRATGDMRTIKRLLQRLLYKPDDDQFA